jgi:predicted regulator of Ras-like GTPase activity (Roadblock/LC7/MglB family)
VSDALQCALDGVTRIRGVRGALVVTGDDGMIVVDALMEGVRGNAVAALAAGVALRFGNAARTTGIGSPHFFHLQAAEGTLVVVPGPTGVLVVVVGDRDLNVGLVRLEMLRVAEVVR